MGILLLAFFVLGSLAFSLWAWRSYSASCQKELDDVRDDPAVLIILGLIGFLGAIFLELARHYTQWSFNLRIGVSVGSTILAQHLALRALERIRQKN